jgi:beta-N-acetylhexosaminidase
MIMLDVAGLTLTEEDRALIASPKVYGVILFSRNFESLDQLKALTRDIHEVDPNAVIAVDQEGGRVQRFKTGFTRIPAMRTLGELYDQDPATALKQSFSWAVTMATELRACGVDQSFAPVLDVDYSHNTVIGDRAFHSNPAVVAELALQFMKGMQHVGMQAIVKHFPGHGYVQADSHLEAPVDDRPMKVLFEQDILPFQCLIDAGVDAIMPAHVVYASIDSKPAGFSTMWLTYILRRKLGFQGLIFSDDLHMLGAAVAGNMAQRVKAAKAAGCDVALICNDRPGVLSLGDWRVE